AFQAADGVERVADDDERHVVAVLGEIRDARPRITRGVIAVRDGGRRIRRIESARDVDPPNKQRTAVLLYPNRNRGRDSPRATGRKCGGEQEGHTRCSDSETHEWQ